MTGREFRIEGDLGVRAALAAITPPAALLALIETGPGRNLDCSKGPALEQAARLQ